jgi:biotin transport system substrate-specific component
MFKKISVKNLTYSALFTALISVLSYITIPLPFSPVPITAQSLAVMAAAVILSTQETALAIGTFLFLGIVGIPVFSGGRAGLGVIFGPSGGYLIGFLIGGIIISLLTKNKENFWQVLAGVITGGIIVIHFLGFIWLSQATGMGLKEAFLAGSLPFIPGDLFKAVLASYLGIRINKSLGNRY